MNKNDNISAAIIIVAYGHEASIQTTLDAIAKDKGAGDKVILVDNHPKHGCAAIACKHKAVDHVIEAENNGFGAGCNAGAAAAKDVDFLFFLNPDAVPQEKFLTELKRAYVERPEWGAWMCLLLLPNGTVNTAGNVVHVSGLSWVTGFGDDAKKYATPTECVFLSGACLAIRKEVWNKLGGFTPEYFLYYEDTAMATRIFINGVKAGLWPASEVVHDYDFKNSKLKWYYIERNRYLYMLTTWPLPVLLLLSPILFGSELGLWAVSLLQRRFILRSRAVAQVVGLAPTIYRLRKEAQSTRSISSKAFLNALSADLDNPFLGKISEVSIVSKVFRFYQRVVSIMLP